MGGSVTPGSLRNDLPRSGAGALWRARTWVAGTHTKGVESVSTDSARPPGGEIDEAVAAAVEVLRPEDQETEAGVQRQMDVMYHRDRRMAIGFVAALLVVLPFIVIAMWPHMPDTATKVVLIGAALVLAIYNCASMLVLVRNYHEDRDFIYRRDVAHLELLRAARKAGD